MSKVFFFANSQEDEKRHSTPFRFETLSGSFRAIWSLSEDHTTSQFACKELWAGGNRHVGCLSEGGNYSVVFQFLQGLVTVR